MPDEKKCWLRWHDFSISVTSALEALRYNEDFFDVTIACDGHTVRAHKLVLSACSDYFCKVLKDYPCDHPTVILDDIRYGDLIALLQFMYCGEVIVEESCVPTLLVAALSLEVTGLNCITSALISEDSKSEEIETSNKICEVDCKNSCTNRNLSSTDCEDLLEDEPTSSPKRMRIKSPCRDTEDSLVNNQTEIVHNVSENFLANGIIQQNLNSVYKKDRVKGSNVENHVRKLEAMVNGGDFMLKREDSSEDSFDSTSETEENAEAAHTVKQCVHSDLTTDTASELESRSVTNPLALNYAALMAAYGAHSSSGSFSAVNSFGMAGSNANYDELPMQKKNYSNNNSITGTAQLYVHPSSVSQQEVQATLEQYQRRLAFHEPRPCPTCKRMYRDAATLRTHMAIMHAEGKEPFHCSCGALFRTKYDMYQHKKNGHR